MAAFRPWLPCICLFLVSLRGTLADEDNGFALAKQWETYANGVNERLSEEQKKSASLKADLDKSSARVGDLEKELAEKEKGVKQKEKEILSLKKQLESVAKSDVKSLEEQLEKQKTKVQELLEVTKKQAKDLTSAKEESSSSKAKGEELLKLQSRITFLKSELQAAEKGAAKYNECHVALLEKEEIVRATRKEILQKEEEIAQLSLELGQISGHILPLWLAKHYSVLQSHTHYHWKTYGEPAVAHGGKTISKAASDLGTWATPHLSNAHTAWGKITVSANKAFKPAYDFTNTKVFPFVGKHLTNAQTFVSPYFETLKSHSKNGYKWVVDKTTPYYSYAEETYGPHVTVAFDYAKPHINKFQSVVSPYYTAVQSKALYHHSDMKSKVKKLAEKFGYALEERFLSILAIFILLLPLLLVYTFTQGYLGPKKRRSTVQEKVTNVPKKIKKVRRDQ